jgi:hypothetical protein
MGKGTEPGSASTPTIDPNAPAGGGGPGFFREPFSLNEDGSPSLSIAHRKGPATKLWVAQAKTTPVSVSTKPKPTKPKKPPVTKPSTSVVIKKSNKDVDIDIKIKILADTTSNKLPAKTAATDFKFKNFNYKYPKYALDPNTQKIAKFTTKFIFKGTIIIQTLYGSKAKATDLSVYGRGTTTADKASGKVTLGFHESCHRQDYLNYPTTHPIPLFKMNIGDTPAEYNNAKKEFEKKLKQYPKDMKAESTKNTDEVGYKLSKCKADKKCK